MTTHLEAVPVGLHEDDDVVQGFEENRLEAFVISGPVPTLDPDLLEYSVPARGYGLCD